MNINQIVGAQIRKIRMAQHLSQSHLADMVYKSKGTISKYEQGSVTIDIQALDDIACALHVSLHYLLGSYNSARYGKKVQLNGDLDESERVWSQTYLYFHGGRRNYIRTHLIEIDYASGEAYMYCDVHNANEKESCSYFYKGRCKKVSSQYRIEFYNVNNSDDIFVLQCVDPLYNGNLMLGLVSHFSEGAFPSFSTKCMLSSKSLQIDEALKNALSFSKEEINELKHRKVLYSNPTAQTYEIILNR